MTVRLPIILIFSIAYIQNSDYILPMDAIFPCTSLAKKILNDSQQSAQAFHEQYKQKPTLCVVLVGEDPASLVYIKKKSEACNTHSLAATDIHLPESTSQAELDDVIEKLNQDPSIHGILVQCPLPQGLSQSRIQGLIDPKKDVDCFHPTNTGKLMNNPQQAFQEGLVPCTPAGIMEILKENDISIDGKNAVVLGRSNLVGKPMALLLLGANATVTLCHSRTRNVSDECKRADILIVAVGKPQLVTQEFVKPGAVVIDVGINRVNVDGKNRLVGDVDQTSVSTQASLLTPVPKGVGVMTIAMLIRNTVRAAWNQKK